MDFGNPVVGIRESEDGTSEKLKQWKQDDSIWMSLDFPRVCVETLMATNGKNCGVKGYCLLDCENADPVARSDMFSCLLESARRKLEEAITGSCKKPCCVDSTKEQVKRDKNQLDLTQQGAQWDATMAGLGFKGYSQEVHVPMLLEKQGDSMKKLEDSYFSEGFSMWIADTTPQCEPEKPAPPGSPHEGLFFVLPFLVLKDLLSVEQVCKSLKDAVSSDVLLWRHLKVDYSLNTKLTDEVLLKLAARGQGRLQSLMLIDCLRISDKAVEQVVLSNPMISRIYLPGCIRISVDTVVRMVEFLQQRGSGSQSIPGVRQIKIRGLSGPTKENLERLQILLGVDEQKERTSKPHYYLFGDASTNIDERAIDVEACLKCGHPRAVYDCTREKCRDWKAQRIPECRGCIFCIPRCEECGMCIDGTDYEETFCLRLLCSECWKRLPKCLECNRPGKESSSDFIRRPDAMFVCPDCQGAYKGGAGSEFYVI